jgi:(S)-2-hydroxyglutarate dehydrogenase
MKNYDVTIIGAGIVGLATAYKLIEQKPTLKILILEKEKDIALHQTGHNSGVIHSGIYYKPNSLKAINCKKGYDQLLTFCKENGIEFDLCGKVIVAVVQKELQSLDNIFRHFRSSNWHY